MAPLILKTMGSREILEADARKLKAMADVRGITLNYYVSARPTTSFFPGKAVIVLLEKIEL